MQEVNGHPHPLTQDQINNLEGNKWIVEFTPGQPTYLEITSRKDGSSAINYAAELMAKQFDPPRLEMSIDEQTARNVSKLMDTAHFALGALIGALDEQAPVVKMIAKTLKSVGSRSSHVLTLAGDSDGA